MLLEIIIIEKGEVLGERGFQARVTLCNTPIVAVVLDIKQIAHRRLLTTSTIGEAQLTRHRLLPTEVKSRREVDHRTRRICMNALIVLHEMCLLRNHLETDIEIIGRTNDAQHHLTSMNIVLIFRLTTQFHILIHIKRISQSTQICIPVTIGRNNTGIVDTCQTIGSTIALRKAVLVGIAELQVHLTHDWLAVGHSGAIAPSILRRHTVTVGLFDRVARAKIVHQLEHLREVIAHRLAPALAPVTIQLQGDVTSLVIQTSVELQHTTEVLRFIIADTILLTEVPHEAILLYKFLHRCQRIVSIIIGVFVESSSHAGVSAITDVISEVRAEQDVRH